GRGLGAADGFSNRWGRPRPPKGGGGGGALRAPPPGGEKEGDPRAPGNAFFVGPPGPSPAMTIYHVHFTCAPDYLARRLPFRPAHLRQLASLREQGLVVAGGPEPDGTAAHIFYRVPDRVGLDRLIEQNEFNRAGLFV